MGWNKVWYAGRSFLPACSLLLLGNSHVAHGADWQPYPASRINHFVNPRPAGMGEAFTAVADDQNALYYNPAGLGKLGPWGLDYIDVIAPILGVSDYDIEAVQPVQEMAKLNFSLMMSDSKVYDQFREILKDVGGNPYYLRAGLNPYFIKKNFGFAIYLNNETTMSAHTGPVPLRIEDIADADIRGGYAHQFFGEKLSVGGTLAWRTRGSLDKSLRLDEWETFKDDKEWYKKEIKTGYGIGADAGLLFTPIETWSPTFGLSVLNVGDTKFYELKSLDKFSNARPDPIPQSVNMGLSVTPRFGKRLFVRASADFRDVNLPVASSQKFKLGFEGGIERLITAQLGLSDEHISAGIEAKLFILNVRYATYVVERGYDIGQKPERRHLLSLKVLL